MRAYVDSDSLTNIADAIREKTETSTKYSLDEMLKTVKDIQTKVNLEDIYYMLQYSVSISNIDKYVEDFTPFCWKVENTDSFTWKYRFNRINTDPNKKLMWAKCSYANTYGICIVVDADCTLGDMINANGKNASDTEALFSSPFSYTTNRGHKFKVYFLNEGSATELTSSNSVNGVIKQTGNLIPHTNILNFRSHETWNQDTRYWSSNVRRLKFLVDYIMYDER